MTEKQALAAVEDKHGSVEEFVLYAMQPDNELILDSQVSIKKRAEEAGIEPKVLHYLLTQSTTFRRLMGRVLANTRFDMMAEDKHLSKIAKVASGDDQRDVISPTGEKLQVDHDPQTLMKAGEYLHKYRGTPLDGIVAASGHTLILNFPTIQQANGAEDDGRTITIGDKGGPVALNPIEQGALPPEGARKRYREGNSPSEQGHSLTSAGGELDFYSQEAPSKAGDYEKAVAEARGEPPEE